MTTPSDVLTVEELATIERDHRAGSLGTLYGDVSYSRDLERRLFAAARQGIVGLETCERFENVKRHLMEWLVASVTTAKDRAIGRAVNAMYGLPPDAKSPSTPPQASATEGERDHNEHVLEMVCTCEGLPLEWDGMDINCPLHGHPQVASPPSTDARCEPLTSAARRTHVQGKEAVDVAGLVFEAEWWLTLYDAIEHPQVITISAQGIIKRLTDALLQIRQEMEKWRSGVESQGRLIAEDAIVIAALRAAKDKLFLEWQVERERADHNFGRCDELEKALEHLCSLTYGDNGGPLDEALRDARAALNSGRDG